MAAHCFQPSAEHSNAVNIIDPQSEKRKKKRKKKKEPSYSVNGEVIWSDNIWDDNELTYYRRLREFWSTLCVDDRIEIASLEKESVVLKMKEQQRITCNCDCCTQERREFETDVEECFALYHDELIRVDMRNDYGDKITQMPLEECTLNDTEFVFYWSLSSDGHQICVSPELVEGGALFIDLLESSQFDEGDEDFYDRDFEDIQEATDDLTEVQLSLARLLVGRKFFQTFIARMFEERLNVAYREKLAYDKQQKLIAEEEEEERLRKVRDENRQLARQRKRDRKKEQKKAAADRKKAEDAENQRVEQRKREEEQQLKLEEEKKRKDKRRITRTSKNDDDECSSNSSGSRSSSIERALLENVPEQAKVSECINKKKSTNNNNEKKTNENNKVNTKLKKENKPPTTAVIANNSNLQNIAKATPMESNDNKNNSNDTNNRSKKRRRKKNKKGDVDTDILLNNTSIPGSSSIIPKKDEPIKTSRVITDNNITVGSNRVSPPNITKAAAPLQQLSVSPEGSRVGQGKREQPVPKNTKVSPKSSKPLYEKLIQIQIPPLKQKGSQRCVMIKKTQSPLTMTTTVVASTVAPGYERSINSVTSVSSFITIKTTQAMQLLNTTVSTSSNITSSTQSVWGTTSPISSLLSDVPRATTVYKPKISEPDIVLKPKSDNEPRIPTPKAIGSERAADRAIGSERAKCLQKEININGINEASSSPFAPSNQPFFLGLQSILSSAKSNDKPANDKLFDSIDELSTGFPPSWTSSAQPSLWSTAPVVISQNNSVNNVPSGLETSTSSRSSPEVNSLWMQQPPAPSQTPPWSCGPIGPPKVPLTPPPMVQQQNSSIPRPGIIHIPRSLALQSNPSLSPFQGFSNLDERGVRQWTPKLHSGFEMPPMRPS